MVVGFIKAGLIAKAAFLRQVRQVQTGHAVIPEPGQQLVRLGKEAVVGNPRIPGIRRGRLHGRDDDPCLRSHGCAVVQQVTVVNGNFSLVVAKACVKIAAVQIAQPVPHQVKVTKLPLAHGLLENAVGLNHGVFQQHLLLRKRLQNPNGAAQRAFLFDLSGQFPPLRGPREKVACRKHQPHQQEQHSRNFRCPL